MLFCAIGIIAAYYFVKIIWYYYRIWSLIRKFPGPKYSSIIFGNWNVLCQPPEILVRKVKELYNSYYPHCFIRICNVFGIMLMTPEDCEIFLSTPKHTRKSILYDIFKRWLKDGLLLSSGEKWQQRRKVLTPAFHFSLLKEFIKTFNEKTDEFICRLSAKGTEAINVVPEIQEFSLLTINETAMGHKMEMGDNNQKEYRDGVCKMEELFNQWIVRPWLTNEWIYMLSSFCTQEQKIISVLHSYTTSIIKKRMEETNKNMGEKYFAENEGTRKRRMAMLDILIKAHNDHKQIDFEGICEEVDTFTFEGHDTVSAASSFCLMLLANHPEIQNQILEEITSVLGDGVSHSTYEDLQKMELLERCIKESLRLYPSVHIISRIVDEDTKLSSGLIVPKDALIFIPILFIHRNPDIYSDPEKFDPDRFLLDNCLQRHPYAYIPFSAGPRNCIGQRFAMLEMKVLLSAVIKKFQLLPVDTPETIELRLETILRATNGVKVKFIPRA